MSEVRFTEDAWQEYLYWQGEDKRTPRKINRLIQSVQREPFKGEVKPEPLKNYNSQNGQRRVCGS